MKYSLDETRHIGWLYLSLTVLGSFLHWWNEWVGQLLFGAHLDAAEFAVPLHQGQHDMRPSWLTYPHN